MRAIRSTTQVLQFAVMALVLAMDLAPGVVHAGNPLGPPPQRHAVLQATTHAPPLAVARAASASRSALRAARRIRPAGHEHPAAAGAGQDHPLRRAPGALRANARGQRFTSVLDVNGVRFDLEQINPLGIRPDGTHNGSPNCGKCCMALDATLGGEPRTAGLRKASSDQLAATAQHTDVYGKAPYDREIRSGWRWQAAPTAIRTNGGSLPSKYHWGMNAYSYVPVKAAIEEELLDAGHGARGVVLGQYGNDGHYFMAYNQFGRVRWLDPQAGTVVRDAEWRAYHGFVFLRTY